jgi:hypothetical protein
MTGGLMQLVAYGAQDIYLTGNPMITYFKVVYRRHTNFAMESIQQVFNGSAVFGSRVTCLISRNGDLVSGITLEATLPKANVANSRLGQTYVDDVGHHLIEQVDVEIGGQLIDRHYADWLEIWAQLTVPAGQEVGYRMMIGQTQTSNTTSRAGLQLGGVANNVGVVTTDNGNPQSTNAQDRKVYVPLQFWFCRNVGLALPLIALQYHEVKVTVQFAPATHLLIAPRFNDDAFGTPVSNNNQRLVTSYVDGAAGTAPADALEASLWVDYIYLDTDERRRFAQVSHEYLIEQLQFSGNEAYGQSPTQMQINLHLNHPVKELVWVAKETARKPNGGVVTIAVNNEASGVVADGHTTIPTSSVNEHSNYTDISALTYANAAAKNGGAVAVNNTTIASSELHKNPSSADRLARNPVLTAKLQLNGHDRFATRDGTYFNRVQTRCHTRIPQSPGINVYSFALKPEDHQPSGTCNFSRIDNARLVLTLSNALRGGNVKVFATNYNVLRIMSGMGGLAYSN